MPNRNEATRQFFLTICHHPWFTTEWSQGALGDDDGPLLSIIFFKAALFHYHWDEQKKSTLFKIGQFFLEFCQYFKILLEKELSTVISKNIYLNVVHVGSSRELWGVWVCIMMLKPFRRKTSVQHRVQKSLKETFKKSLSLPAFTFIRQFILYSE